MARSLGSRTLLSALLSAALLAFLAAPAPAATEVKGSSQLRAIKALAKQPKVKRGPVRVSVSGKTVKLISHGLIDTANMYGVFRSSASSSWRRIDIVARGGQLRYTAILRKSGSRTKLLYWGQRYDVIDYLCARRSPSTAVVLDLGLGPVAKGAYGVKKCRYERDQSKLITAMSAAEIADLRAKFELQYGETPDGGFGWSSPVEAEFEETSADCDWNGAQTDKPRGQVSRADPRYGVLAIACVGGSVNGVGAYYSTHLLVSRAGKSGPFTRLIAHVVPAWSPQTRSCATDRKWPVPLAARIQLEFCTPFPQSLWDFNGPTSL